MSAEPARGARPLLYTDRGCPFSHRVLALLHHLGVEHDLREAAPGSHPPGLSRHGHGLTLPLLVQGGLVLTQSRVMLEHLAEHYGATDAWPRALADRTRHRHAIAVFDDTVGPLLFCPSAQPDGERLGIALRTLAGAALAHPPAPCLLALHVAPIWLRFRWWQPDGAVTRAIEGHAELCRWLDDAAELDCIASTAPDRALHLADMERARRAGLFDGPCNGPSRASAT